MKSIKTKRTWKIANFSRRMSNGCGDSFFSSTFSIKNSETCVETEWYLTFFPNGRYVEDTGFLEIFLCPEETEDLSQKLQIVLEIPRRVKLCGWEKNWKITFDTAFEKRNFVK